MANAVANLHPTAGIPYQEKEMNGHDIWKQYYKKVAAQSWDPDNLGYRAKCTSAIDHEDQLNKVQLNTN